MTCDEFFTRLKQQEWVRASRLQEWVMPLFFSMGEVFEVTEIDLRPTDHAVYVYGSFRGRNAMVMFRRSCGEKRLVIRVEMFLGNRPEQVSEVFANEMQRLIEEENSEVLDRRSILALVADAGAIESGEELKTFCDHHLRQVKRAAQLLKEGDTPPFVPAMKKGETMPAEGDLVN